MARALLTMIVLALATTAGAKGPCDEAQDRTGLTVVVRDGAVVVSAVAPDSAAATSGVRPGDVVMQANGTVARSCAEWGRTVGDARDGAKALLLLVGRGDDEVVLAIGRKTWGGTGGTAVAAPAETPPARGFFARPATPVETPPPFPADVTVTLDSVVADLGGLVGRTRTGLASYRDAVTASRRAVETLAVRKAATPDAVTGLRRVARLHETAVLAWAAMDTIRERDGIARRLPISDAASAPYFSNTPTQSALDEFDFLHETIASEPRNSYGFAESSGAWHPAAARRLAWEHAGEELGRLTATLASTP
jgi:hypothetical protein